MRVHWIVKATILHNVLWVTGNNCMLFRPLKVILILGISLIRLLLLLRFILLQILLHHGGNTLSSNKMLKGCLYLCLCSSSISDILLWKSLSWGLHLWATNQMMLMTQCYLPRLTYPVIHRYHLVDSLNLLHYHRLILCFLLLLVRIYQKLIVNLQVHVLWILIRVLLMKDLRRCLIHRLLLIWII
jgi:hypothetical protein